MNLLHINTVCYIINVCLVSRMAEHFKGNRGKCEKYVVASVAFSRH